MISLRLPARLTSPLDRWGVGKDGLFGRAGLFLKFSGGLLVG